MQTPVDDEDDGSASGSSVASVSASAQAFTFHLRGLYFLRGSHRLTHSDRGIPDNDSTCARLVFGCPQALCTFDGRHDAIPVVEVTHRDDSTCAPFRHQSDLLFDIYVEAIASACQDKRPRKFGLVFCCSSPDGEHNTDA